MVMLAGHDIAERRFLQRTTVTSPDITLCVSSVSHAKDAEHPPTHHHNSPV
jgi:hypothetical protein